MGSHLHGNDGGDFRDSHAAPGRGVRVFGRVRVLREPCAGGVGDLDYLPQVIRR